MNITRTSFSLRSIINITGAIIFIVSTFLIQYSFKGTLSYIWIILIVFGVILLEGSIADLKQSRLIGSNTINDTRKGRSADTARVINKARKTLLLPTIILSVIASIAVFGLLLIAFKSILLSLLQGGESSFGLLVNLGLLIVYIAIRKSVISPLMEKYKKNQGSKFATFTVSGKNLIIDLGLRSQRQIQNITIPLAEITEMKSLNYQQVKAFANYEVGPDLSLAKQSAKDFLKIVKGNTNRPKAYLQTIDNVLVHHIVMKGDDFFYVIATEKENADATVTAWKNR